MNGIISAINLFKYFRHSHAIKSTKINKNALIYYINSSYTSNLFFESRTFSTSINKSDDLEQNSYQLDNYKKNSGYKLKPEDYKKIAELREKDNLTWVSILNDHFPESNLHQLNFAYERYTIERKKDELKVTNQWPYDNPDYKENYWSAEDDQKLIEAYNKYQSFNKVKKYVFPHKYIFSLRRRYQHINARQGNFTENEIEKFKEGVALFGKDWSKIAKHVGTRTSIQCRKLYPFLEIGKDPAIKERWSKSETQRLEELIKVYGTDDWDLLAEKFGTSKCKPQIMSKYFYSLRPNINKGEWSAEEDDELLELVEKHGPRSWSKIGKEMAKYGRTSISCFARYQKINPALKTGEWSLEEEQKLLEFAELHSNKWPVVSQCLGTRTPYDCELKWYKMKLPNLKTWYWDEEEVKKLKELVGIYGKDWRTVSLKLGTRTPTMCRAKYPKISNKDV